VTISIPGELLSSRARFRLPMARPNYFYNCTFTSCPKLGEVTVLLRHFSNPGESMPIHNTKEVRNIYGPNGTTRKAELEKWNFIFLLTVIPNWANY
jgi:hypothetical protein